MNCTKCGCELTVYGPTASEKYVRYRCKPCTALRMRQWAAKNRQRSRQLKREYVSRHPERNLASKVKWAAANKHVAMEVVRRRQANKKKATPAWANKFFMQEAYHLALLRAKATGVPHDVDHIVPLQSPLVCGLHCEFNLQVIPRRENRLKHNRYWPDMPTG